MRTILILFLIFFTINCFSQTNTLFKVIAASGNVTIKAGNKTTQVYTGTTLNAHQQVLLEEKSWLSVLHQSGEILEISKKGKYYAKDIEMLLTNNNNRLAAKYAENFIKLHKTPNTTPKKTRKDNYELVSNAADSLPAEKTIELLIPSSVEILQKNIQLWWRPANEQITITLKNEYDEVLLTKTPPDTSISINLENELFKDLKLLTVQIGLGLENENTSEYAIKLKEDAALNLELKQLINEVPFINNTYHIILASFFEMNNLHAEALMHYTFLLSNNTDSENIANIYQEFLQRRGF